MKQFEDGDDGLIYHLIWPCTSRETHAICRDGAHNPMHRLMFDSFVNQELNIGVMCPILTDGASFGTGTKYGEQFGTISFDYIYKGLAKSEDVWQPESINMYQEE